jgi:NDP-sugar pyrophosphorylase family protein
MEKINFADFFGEIPQELKPLLEESKNIWDIFKNLNSFLESLVKEQNDNPSYFGKIGDAYLAENVFIGEGTVVEHGAMIKGPTFIGQNCQVRSGAYIRGGVFTGDNVILGHATEIKNSILLEGTNAGHFNYLGDSFLGKEVNLGAGTILANLRFDKQPIVVGDFNTGLKKLGAILGDYSQTGCNTVLNPGTFFKPNTFYSGMTLKGGIYDKEAIKEIIRANK